MDINKQLPSAIRQARQDLFTRERQNEAALRADIDNLNNGNYFNDMRGQADFNQSEELTQLRVGIVQNLIASMREDAGLIESARK